MKKLIALSIVLALVVPVMASTTMQIAGYGPHRQGSGGEFSFTNLTNYNPADYYASSVMVDGAGNATTWIQTFCLEKNENLYTNTTYTVQSISNEVVMGGNGGPSPDPISKGTAWLYYQFSKGVLAEYDYTPGADRRADAELLQIAIWQLEEESLTATELALSSGANKFYNAVVTQFTSFAAAQADYTGTAVRAVNIGDPTTPDRPGNMHQSVLITVPAPGALILASLGTGFVGWLRRRKA